MLFVYPQKLACLCLVLFLFPSIAHASNLFEAKPQLRIDPRMHTSQIDRIGVNKDCTLMVTGSMDKTARLWKLPPPTDEGVATPRLLRTFRPPINPKSNDGHIHAVAMHPDGKLVAASGHTPSTTEGLWSIYFFDAQTAEVVATIEDNPHRVKHLTFSMDGEYLAATMIAGFGMRVWKTSNWERPIAKDNMDYGDSYSAAFDNKGRLYTIAWDKEGSNKHGYLRRYSSKNFDLESQVEIEGGPRPYHVAVQPHGDRVAVSLLSQAGVYLYRSLENGLKFVGEADTSDLQRGIGKISWSTDGEHLFAGGSYNKDNHYLFRVWGDSGQGRPKDFEGTNGVISHLLPCGDFIAFGARDPAFGLIDWSGNRRVWQSRVGADMRRTQFGHLKVSDDGQRISFGLGFESNNTIIFDVRELRLDNAPDNTTGLHAADYDSLPITEWNEKDTIPFERRPNNPLLDGEPIAPMLNPDHKEKDHRVNNGEEWISLAIAPNKRDFVLGSEWRLRGYDKHALEKPLWVKKVPGAVWAVNIVRDGKLLVAAYDDGTIRWHRMVDGKELLALFVHAEDLHWIAWTPKGYFFAEVGGEDLLGWHVNNGPTAAADFFPAYEYRDSFFGREIIKRVLSVLDEDMAIKSAKLNQDNFDDLRDKIVPLPVVIIHSPSHSPTFSDSASAIPIRFSVRLPFGFESAKVDVLVDGVEQRTFNNPQRQDLEKKGLTAWVKLPKRDSVVSVVATAFHVREQNRVGVFSIPFKYAGSVPEKDELPKLFGLVIGVADNYEGNDKLEFADNDAKDFKAALEAQKGRVFRDTAITALINGAATAENIESELIRLRKNVKRETADTITVVFYSGHGVEDNGNRFYIMPAPLQIPDKLARYTKEEYFKRYGFSQDDLLHLIRQIPGRKLLFFDACRSGSVNSANFVNTMNVSGRLSTFTFSSTASGNISVECKGNGCFTKALLEALNDGSADWFSPKNVTNTEELRQYLRQMVPKYSKGTQRPTMLSSDKELLHFDVAKHQ